jgi:hypothetical protein
MGGSQTTSSTQNQNQVQGQTPNAGLDNALSSVLGFDQNLMSNGMDQATREKAMQQNQMQNEQSISNIMKNLGPSSANPGGLAEDLGKQATMSNAQTSADLAATDQQMKASGAAGVQQIGQLENPSTYYSTGSANGSSTSSSNPGFGGFLGSLMGGLSQAGGNAMLSGMSSARSGMDKMNPMTLPGAGMGGL